MNGKRLKRILVPERMIIGALRGIRPAPFPGLPPDVEFEWASYDPGYNAFWIFLSHPSWPEVPKCTLVPEVIHPGDAEIPTWRDRPPQL